MERTGESASDDRRQKFSVNARVASLLIDCSNQLWEKIVREQGKKWRYTCAWHDKHERHDPTTRFRFSEARGNA